MKKKVAIFTLFFLGLVAVSNAQGGFQRKTVEERVQTIHSKMDSAYHPDAATLTKIDHVFTQYYSSQDKAREEMMSGGERPDRDAMQAKMQPIVDARDKELKTLLTADQFTNFKTVLEPSMRPARQGGGGRPQN